MPIFAIFLLVLLIFVVITVIKTIVLIPQGEAAVIERLGSSPVRWTKG